VVLHHMPLEPEIRHLVRHVCHAAVGICRVLALADSASEHGLGHPVIAEHSSEPCPDWRACTILCDIFLTRPDHLYRAIDLLGDFRGLPRYVGVVAVTEGAALIGGMDMDILRITAKLIGHEQQGCSNVLREAPDIDLGGTDRDDGRWR